MLDGFRNRRSTDMAEPIRSDRKALERLIIFQSVGDNLSSFVSKSIQRHPQWMEFVMVLQIVCDIDSTPPQSHHLIRHTSDGSCYSKVVLRRLFEFLWSLKVSIDLSSRRLILPLSNSPVFTRSMTWRTELFLIKLAIWTAPSGRNGLRFNHNWLTNGWWWSASHTGWIPSASISFPAIYQVVSLAPNKKRIRREEILTPTHIKTNRFWWTPRLLWLRYYRQHYFQEAVSERNASEIVWRASRLTDINDTNNTLTASFPSIASRSGLIPVLPTTCLQRSSRPSVVIVPRLKAVWASTNAFDFKNSRSGSNSANGATVTWESWG